MTTLSETAQYFARRSWPPADNPHLSKTPLRVLLVDDEPSWREAWGQALMSQGHRVTALDVGESAAALNQAWDVVVVGTHLSSGINGAELARALRDGSRGAQQGIVLVSNEPRQAHARLLRASRADAVVGSLEADTEFFSQVACAGHRRRLTFRPVKRKEVSE